MPLHRKVIFSRYFCGFVFCLVVIFYFIIYRSLPDGSSRQGQESKEVSRSEKLKFTGPLTKENLPERITIIIREFEDFDNALSQTVESLEAALGPIPILIVADQVPYPPVKLKSKGLAQIITLSSDLTKNYSSACPLSFVNTQYVFIVPDAVKILDWKEIKNFVAFLRSKLHTTAVAVAVGKNKLQCHNLNVDLKQWFISFHGNYTENMAFCPLVKGSHGLLMKTETFKSLAEPFARPFPFTFYVQARLKDWKIRIMNSGRLNTLSELYTEPHSNWKHKTAESERVHSFYKVVGIKQETLATGVHQYYGCTKNTARCFGTVIDDMPEYLYQGRWTPPCCLKALRETASHVFAILDKHGVRYWLEGGSLLGAARHKDIIPWDYDIDIGIYKEDIDKCPFLIKAKEEQYIDDEEFVWEKATEGDFFRVQYSEVNHLHVDIYPFYSKNGIMTKDTWFLTHRQDTEFPERFLKPLTKIEFAGIMAGAPNSVKEFLEYKFGEGVIEHPRYPNLQKPL